MAVIQAMRRSNIYLKIRSLFRSLSGQFIFKMENRVLVYISLQCLWSNLHKLPFPALQPARTFWLWRLISAYIFVPQYFLNFRKHHNSLKPNLQFSHKSISNTRKNILRLYILIACKRFKTCYKYCVDVPI